MTHSPSSPDIEQSAWRYEIQHGPDGETDYAWVYNGANNLICTTKTHYAIAMVAALRATQPAAPAGGESGEAVKDALKAAEEALNGCYEVQSYPGDGSSSQDFALAQVRSALASFVTSSAMAQSDEGSQSSAASEQSTWWRDMSDREPDHGQYANGGPAERAAPDAAQPSWHQIETNPFVSAKRYLITEGDRLAIPFVGFRIYEAGPWIHDGFREVYPTHWMDLPDTSSLTPTQSEADK